MKVSDFIGSDIGPILDAWERFANTIASADQMAPAALRDHVQGTLQAIAADLDCAQSPEQ